MSPRTSLPPPNDKPSKTLATRILVSFAVTLLAFAVTVGFTVAAQKRAAEDSEELASGFVPVALKLGKLRAIQSTLASIIDGIPDEKNPQSTSDILRALDNERRLMFRETRADTRWAPRGRQRRDAPARARPHQRARRRIGIGSGGTFGSPLG